MAHGGGGGSSVISGLGCDLPNFKLGLTYYFAHMKLDFYLFYLSFFLE